MNLDIQLSPHFTLREMVVTTHRTIDNTPPDAVVDKLRILCADYLERVRDRFGPLVIGSGYRCRSLNSIVGGQASSAHVFGCAADFVPADKKVTTQAVVRWVRSSALLYDQVIDEYSSTSNWVHLGIQRPGTGPARLETLVIRNGVKSPFEAA